MSRSRKKYPIASRGERSVFQTLKKSENVPNGSFYKKVENGHHFSDRKVRLTDEPRSYRK